MQKSARLLALAVMTTALGIVTSDYNVKADTTESEQVTQPATVTTTTPSYDLYANQLAAVHTDVRYGDQAVYLPAGFTLQNITNVDDAASAQALQNQVKKPGLENNNYQSNSQAAQEQIELDNLSDDQVTQMNKYAVDLINQVRYEMGVEPFGQNQGTINAVKGMALQYQDKDESLLNGGWHDPLILQNHSENISAFQIYNDHIAGLGFKPFASAKGNEFEDDSSVPLLSVGTMDDLRAMIYYGVMGMLFYDADDTFGHAKNFLTYYQPINDMGVYPSIVKQTNHSGHYANGQQFDFQVENVDMHFIWADQSTDNHWQQKDGKWSYVFVTKTYDDDGEKTDEKTATGIQHIDGQTYYFNSDGVMQTGWQQVNGDWYFFQDNGAAANGWQWINGHWYFFNNAGVADTGWGQVNQRWYYFDPTNAWANYGWQQLSNAWYYFDPVNAWMQTGWQRINNQWYYFATDSGQMATGILPINNSWYYLNNSGAMQTGWWNLNGHWFLFAADGSGVKNWYRSAAGNWYYFNQYGYAQTGWYQSPAGNWYYFDPTNAWAERGWFWSGYNWYYFDPTNAWALKGFQYLNGNWYYFDPTNAWMVHGWQYIDGHWYYFNQSGQMLAGLVRIDGRLYYLNPYHDGSYGAMLTGQQTIYGRTLSFDPVNGWLL